MAQINRIKEQILRMGNQCSNAYVKEQLTSLLSALIDMAADSYAAVVAETILRQIKKYSRCYCTDKQAYVIARGIYENCLDL